MTWAYQPLLAGSAQQSAGGGGDGGGDPSPAPDASGGPAIAAQDTEAGIARNIVRYPLRHRLFPSPALRRPQREERLDAGTGGGVLVVPTPLSLFDGGADGLLYDFQNGSTLFTERSSPSTPAGSGDPVGTIIDLSPNGNNGVAPSDDARAVMQISGGVYQIAPDATDDGYSFNAVNAALYIAATMIVPSDPPVLSTFLTLEIDVDDNNVRLDSADAWRAPGNSANSDDFSFNGASYINGATGFAFTPNVPFVFEQSAAIGTALGALFLEATTGRWGNMLTRRLIILDYVPTDAQRSTIILPWLNAVL
jgi:hypothetical protein